MTLHTTCTKGCSVTLPLAQAVPNMYRGTTKLHVSAEPLNSTNLRSFEMYREVGVGQK